MFSLLRFCHFEFHGPNHLKYNNNIECLGFDRFLLLVAGLNSFLADKTVKLCDQRFIRRETNDLHLKEHTFVFVLFYKLSDKRSTLESLPV